MTAQFSQQTDFEREKGKRDRLEEHTPAERESKKENY